MTLARLAINDAHACNISDSDFSAMVKASGWTLDSWIQAAANKFTLSGRSLSEFKALIENILYSNIRALASGLGIDSYLTTVLNNPMQASRDRVIEVCDFIETAFPNSSLLQVGRFLIDAAHKNLQPAAVLTFNADTLLETYITLKLRSDHYKGPGPHGHPAYPYSQVTRAEAKSSWKTPIIHLHGAISPKPGKGVRHRDSRDRSVFLEQEYLSMSTGGACWSESIFLHFAFISKFLFVGLSLSDSNIRRWMNAVQMERSVDLMTHGVQGVANPKNVWLKCREASGSLDEVYLSSLWHLGVRPALIDNWGQVYDALHNLSGI